MSALLSISAPQDHPSIDDVLVDAEAQ